MIDIFDIMLIGLKYPTLWIHTVSILSETFKTNGE